MAQDTFGMVWNRVRLYAPDAPVGVIQQAVKNTYQRVITDHYWSELRAEASLLTKAVSTTGTAVFTNGSTTVSGVGTDWTSAMINRQIAPNNIAPWYTITAVAGVTSMTIDRAFGGPTSLPAGISYRIGNFYLDLPTDYRAMDEIRDLNTNWRLRTQQSQQAYIDRIDPKRTFAGTPILYVAAPTRLDTNNVRVPRLEFWPRIEVERELVYRYYKNHTLSADSDRIIDALRPECLVYGALAELALWPGTGAKPNPFFSPDSHRQYTEMLDEAFQNSVMNDLDRSQTMILDSDDGGLGYPIDAKFMQSHGLV